MTAHSRPIRTLFALLLAAGLLAGLLPARPAAADSQPRTIYPDLAREAIWQAATGAAIRDTWRRTETTLINGFLVEGQGVPRLNEKLNALRARFRRALKVNQGGDVAARLSYDSMVRTMFRLAGDDPALAGLTRRLWLRLGNPENLEGDLSQSQRVVLADSVRRNMPIEGVRRRERAVTRETLNRARQDPAFAAQYDSLFADELGFTLSGFDPRAYLQRDPANPLHRTLLDKMAPDGSLALSLNDLRELARGEFGRVNSSIDELQRAMAGISASQGELVDFMNDERALREARAIAEAEAAEHQLKLDAADSAISIISTLTGFVDPKLGREIGTVGGSLLQIGTTVSGWLEATAGLSALERLTSLSSVVATGNALGAVMNIVGLFSDSGPTPDQMILQEIGRLREQIDQLGTEMRDRFDRVDAQLATIYGTMQDRFDRIDVQLGRINGSLLEIQQTLITLDMRLSRLERNNFEFLDALGRRPLLDAINGAIGYRARTGLAMPYQPDFLSYENTFHTWGTVNAFDALSAGPAQRDYRDSQVLSELNAFPLDANLNYLNGWLVAHGMQPFATRRLPSPRDWLFASRAYARISLDWPEHQRRIDPQRQAGLEAVGRDLEQALRNLTTLSTPAGLAANTPLYTGVISYYTAKLDLLDAGLRGSEQEFVAATAAELGRAAPFDLFGGLEQPVDYAPPALETIGCDGLPAPATLAGQLPDAARYRLAEYLKLTTLDSCMTASLENPRRICQPGQDVCDVSGQLKIVITVYVGQVKIMERSLAAGAVQLSEEDDPDAFVAAGWGRYQGLFERGSVDVPLSPAEAQQRAALLADTSAAVSERLAGYQRAFYRQVQGGLSGQQAGLAAADGLRPTALELAGAKKLLEHMVALGLPQAVANDDLMRSLFYSDASLVDDQQALGAYTGRLVAMEADGAAAPDLTANPRAALMAAAAKRRTALGALVERYAAAATAGTLSADHEMIANARLDLELARRLAVAPEGPAPGAVRLYLPLTRR